MSGPRRIVLTGGPGAGKTTLLDELARRGFRCIPEAARAVLRMPGGLDLRARDPDGFAQAILEREIERFTGGEDCEGTVFFDRGLGDLASMPVSLPALRSRITKAVRDYRYDPVVFRAPAWQAIYRQDSERTQTWVEAVASDKAVTAAWEGAGYTIIDLPMLDPAGRADFVLALL